MSKAKAIKNSRVLEKAQHQKSQLTHLEALSLMQLAQQLMP